MKAGERLTPKDAELNKIIQHACTVVSMATGGWDETDPKDIDLRLSTMRDTAIDLADQIVQARARLRIAARLAP